MWASHCGGVSCQEHRLWGTQASVVAAPWLQSTAVVVAHGLRCPKARGIFPTRDEPTSPAVADGFFTTEPPGKAHCHSFKVKAGPVAWASYTETKMYSNKLKTVTVKSVFSSSLLTCPIN